MTRVERRPSRTAAAARVAAALVLAGAAGLVATALAPQVVGLSAHVVTSGSMAPRVQPGDVVLTQPTTTAELRVGQVLLFADPQRPGGLLLHRLVSFDDAGRLVTRGDANQSDDSVHVAPSAVRGVARLRVPWVGLPAVWRVQGRLDLVAVAAVTLAGAAVLVSTGRRRRPGLTAGSAPPMTGPRRPAASVVRPGSGAGHDTAVLAQATVAQDAGVGGGEVGRAASTGRSLPPVPPTAVRRAPRRPGPPGPGGAGPGGSAGPAGRGHGAAGDHSGCFDGGRLCGQPRR